MSARVDVGAASVPDVRASAADRDAIRDFLFEEARVLDEGEPGRWLGMLAPDIRYLMPTRPSLQRRDRARAAQPRMALYDDDLAMLERRVARMVHPTAWSENPATRMVRQVTNVEAFTTDSPDAWRVHSVVTLYRNRNETEQDLVFARRDDLVRRGPDGLRLARREIRIAQNTLLSKNLNAIL